MDEFVTTSGRFVTEEDIKKIKNRLLRHELKNKLLTSIYGCTHIELDDAIDGDRHVIRFCTDSDYPDIEADINWFFEMVRTLNLFPETFEYYEG